MNRILLGLLLLIACNAPQNNHQINKAKADSLIAYMKSTVTPHLDNQEVDEAKNILDSLAAFALETEDYRLTCTWLGYRNVLMSVQKNPDSARYYAEQSFQLALAKDSSKKFLLDAQRRIAGVLNDERKYDSALHLALDAYRLAQKFDTTQLDVVCLTLFDITDNMDDMESARKYLLEGNRRTKDPVLKTVFANGISRYYADAQKLDSAMLFFKEVERDTSFRTPYFEAIKYSNLGTLLSSNGKPKEGLVYQLKGAEIFRAHPAVTR